MGSKMGFEYRYVFRVDDEMISRYSSWYNRSFTRFVFEIQTSFIVRGEFGRKLIDTERYNAGVEEELLCEEYLQLYMGRRLKDYWMSDDEIRDMVGQALAFAKQVDHQYASCSMVPIVANLDVCTVQQEGEPINATMDRAIRQEFLYPMYLCPVNEAARPKVRPEGYFVDLDLMDFLRDELPTFRVDSVMEACRICWRSPTVGVQISLLQCGHVFHNSCIVRWLEDNNSCPICHQQAHDVLPPSYDDDDDDFVLTADGYNSDFLDSAINGDDDDDDYSGSDSDMAYDDDDVDSSLRRFFHLG